MRRMWSWAVLVCALCVATVNARAAEWHVATNGNDSAAGTNWATAKLTIQAAIDAAVSNDTVWVSNGVYATGGGVMAWGWSNRVAIVKPILLQSARGPDETLIVGDGMRGVYITNGAVLSGFTVTNSYAEYGGGVRCEESGIITNCILAGNSAGESGGGGSYDGILYNCQLIGNQAGEGGGSYGGTLNHCILADNTGGIWGGGARGGTLNNCLLVGNIAPDGGGALFGTLNNCTVVSNTGASGGGALLATLNNCIVYDNIGNGDAENHFQCTFTFSCTTPDPGGTGNLTNHPQFVDAGADNYRLQPTSRCIDAGDNSVVTWDEDLDGNPRIANTTVDMGAYEIPFDLMIDPASTNLPFEAAGGLAIEVTASVPWTATTNVPWLTVTSGDSGATNGTVFFSVESNGMPTLRTGAVIVAGSGISRTCTVIQAKGFTIWHVATNGNDAAAGTNWATAKLTIQAAIDVATSNDTVFVSNGVYATGGGVIAKDWSNRVAITKPILLQSARGPDVTLIVGDGMRGVYVTNGAVLSGFTVTNSYAEYGGGVRCEASGIITNCILVGNLADGCGGGSHGGILYNCQLIGNQAGEGGGSYGGTLTHCLLADNTAGKLWGGGAWGGTLNNCLLMDNVAPEGGGSIFGTLNNCTVVSNTGTSGGGGALLATLNNCVVYSNSGTPSMENYFECTFTFSCTTPDPGGTGNLTNNPQFVDAGAGNYRLSISSPCIDAGDNDVVSWDEDLDGNPRIAYGAVDMGAYEVQLAGPGTWFDAIINGLSNDTDCVAGDGVPNLLKYATGSSPRVSDALADLYTATSNGGPTMVFNRNPNATDITMFIQWADAISDDAEWRGLATNLNGSWGGASNVSESGLGTPVVVTVEDPVPFLTNRFLRLKVTRP